MKNVSGILVALGLIKVAMDIFDDDVMFEKREKKYNLTNQIVSWSQNVPTL